jgi:phage replication-related protein YjqB (UPF0714/DUF867 family)
MDRYADFDSLKENELQDIDYRIRSRLGSSGIAILSIHGGDIEPGTTRIADAVAGHDHSFYTFEGIKNSGNRALHITSTRFDEPSAMQIVCRSEIIISIHGSAALEPVVYLGGLDIDLKLQILSQLRAADFYAVNCLDPCFAAVNQKNICNLCSRGMGVQIEISRGLRAKMFQDLTPSGRFYRTPMFARFVLAVRKAIAPFTALCPETNFLQNTD